VLSVAPLEFCLPSIHLCDFFSCSLFLPQVVGFFLTIFLGPQEWEGGIVSLVGLLAVPSPWFDLQTWAFDCDPTTGMIDIK